MRYACGKSATLPTKVLIASRYTAAATATPTGESTANRSPSTTAALRSSAPTPPVSTFETRATTAPSPPATVPPRSANRNGAPGAPPPPPGQRVRDQGHDGPKHAGNRPDEQREQDRLLERPVGREVRVESPR